MSEFQQGDRVIANENAPFEAQIGQSGTVTDPDYIGHVMVCLDDEELRSQALGCFLPEELEKQ